MTPNHVTTQVIYFDGIGRPVQKIDYQQSTLINNIVTHIEYEQLGR